MSRAGRRTNAAGELYCRKCDDWKAPEAFPLKASTKSGRASNCRSCCAGAQKHYRQRLLQAQRRADLRALAARKKQKFF